MSRSINVVENEIVHNYRLSILTIKLNTDGLIHSFSIEPFDKEQEGVTYHDGVLRIDINADGSISLSEDGRILK